MFKWLKSLFESDVKEGALSINNEALKVEEKDIAPAREPKVEKAKPKKQARKSTTKKAAKVDLDSMSKKDLLALCKKKSIKANASLSKAELIARLNG